MIPKTIHYCWYGSNTLPPLYKRCIDTWSKHLPDFKFVRWDNTNTNMDTPFLQNCLKNKQWAFISDYVRMKAIHEHGGVYLDCDIELIKSISKLLINDCFLGYEAHNRPTSGVIGCIKGHTFPKRCMELIDSRFNNGSTYLIAPEVVSLALKTKPDIEKIKIYGEEYFYPYNPYNKAKNTSTLMFADITENTYAIHHWGKAWSQNLFSRAVKKIGRIISI